MVHCFKDDDVDDDGDDDDDDEDEPAGTPPQQPSHIAPSPQVYTLAPTFPPVKGS